MHLLLIGHGRMGRLVEQYATAHGCTIAGAITAASADSLRASADFGPVDVAVDFSTGSAVRQNISWLAARGWNAVIGTTGWGGDEAACREIVERSGLGVIVSANFSLGMNLFRVLAEDAARRFSGLSGVGAWIHERHHIGKKDAPSGTALMLKAAIERAGFARPIDVSSTRAGSIPGMHEVGFDALAETVTLTHEVRDRAVFAHGALEAARWIHGRRGWFTIDDMMQDWAASPHD